jgi:hypothetical protein
MMILAKAALCTVGTLTLATVYTFRQGTIRVDVDEHHQGGSHVHLWVPAAVVPMALHFVPDDKLQQAEMHADEWLPVVRAVAQSLKQHPQANFVEVQDGAQQEHVQVRTVDGKIRVDVLDPGEEVHVACPISTIEDVAEQLGSRQPDL